MRRFKLGEFLFNVTFHVVSWLILLGVILVVMTLFLVLHWLF